MQMVASQRFKHNLAKNNCRLSNFHCPLPNIHCQLKNFSYLCGVNPPPTISLSIPAYVPRRCMFDRGGLCARQQRPTLKAGRLRDKVVSNHPIPQDDLT